MTGKDILIGLNFIEHRYIEEANSLFCKKKKLSSGKLLLIAAVITAMLMLVGCTVVYVLHLQDMAFGEKVQEYYDGSSQERTLISIQGVKGSPGYLATKEWYEWLENYDKDMAIYHSEEAFSEDFGEDYYEYNLYSREMKDKLDEICAKYGLGLLGRMYVDPDIDAACDSLQIDNIFRPEIQYEAEFDNILYYANGSFDVEGYIDISGAGEHIVSFRCHRKNAFTDLYVDVGPEGTYEEWNYTTSYGVDVVIFIDEGMVARNAGIMADCGEYMYLLSVHEFENMPLPDKTGMELFAETFDFSVQPKQVLQDDLIKSDERLEEANEKIASELSKLMHSFLNLGYEDRIKFQIDNAIHPTQLGFTIMDLEGNGTDDLIVGENGYIRAVYTTADGGTQHMMPLSLVYLNSLNHGTGLGVGELAPGNWSYIYLCENNSLAYVYDLVGDGAAYHFASIVNGEYVWTDRIVYDPANHADEPWQMHDETHNSHPITEAEFQRILNSYKRISLDMYPISDYPLTNDSPSGIGMPATVYEDYQDLISVRTELDKDNTYYHFQLLDFDSDGQREFIWQEGDWTGVFTMKDGQVKHLVSGLDVSLCDGNIIACSRSYLDGNKAYCFYKITNKEAVLVDYLRYDTERDSENPWFRSADLTGQDMTLIPVTEKEAFSVIDSYKYQKLDLKPFDEFSLG